MAVDPLRHKSVFDPTKFTDKVSIIGLGATGSHLAQRLLKLGIKGSQIYGFDADVVGAHNIANQHFGVSDVDMPKTLALQRRLEAETGERINVCNSFVSPDGPPEVRVPQGFVFLLVDSMAARKSIMSMYPVKLQPFFVFESRVGLRNAEVYAFNPAKDLDAWNKTLCDDSEIPAATTGLCRTAQTLGSTVNIAVAMLEWAFMEVVTENCTRFRREYDHATAFGIGTEKK